MKKKIAIFLIFALLLLSGCGMQTDPDKALADSLGEKSLYLVSHGEDSGSLMIKYGEIEEIDNNLPDKVDLRESGTVTSVKNQGQYGTCWACAAIAGSETSILNELGLTVDQYRQQYGFDMDLSEWFHVLYGINPLKDGDVFDGAIIIEPEDEYDPFFVGGNDFTTLSTLSNLIGPNFERDLPYDSEPDYQTSKRGEHRFILQHLNFLSSPAQIDDKGNYTYNPNGTDSIRQALSRGIPVVISYTASSVKPVRTYDSVYNGIKDAEGSDELKDLYTKVRIGEVDTETLSRDQLVELVEFRLAANKRDINTYDFDGKDAAFIAGVLLNPYFGQSQELVFNEVEKNRDYYTICPGTFAQYDYFLADSDHEVLIVGYDDNFSKDNFISEHKPPQDGAWICKNSWGEGSCDEGYFYLSYYDQTITSPVTLDYFLNDDAPKGEVSVYSYDKMPISALAATEFDKKASAANIYEISEDGTIFALGSNTAAYNTEIEYKVYKLNSRDDRPDKGKLLYSGKESYVYAGYHSHMTGTEIEVKKGDIISIVTTQKAGGKYVLVNGFSISQTGYEAIENSEIEYLCDYELTRYFNSVIEEDQSYIKFGNTWYDFKDTIETLNANSPECKYVSFDNPAIKLFAEK